MSANSPSAPLGDQQTQQQSVLLESLQPGPASGTGTSLLVNSVTQQPASSVQTLLKRPLLNEGDDTASPTVSKVYITSSGKLIEATTLVPFRGTTQKVSVTPGTPTRILSVASQHAVAVSPVSSMKSPTKITMIPMGKSPQRIAPASTVVLTKSLFSSGTTTTLTNRPSTITMSPSKLIIKQPQGGSNNAAIKQVINMSSGVQSVHVPGKTFPYVRLVSAGSQAAGLKTGSTISIAPALLQGKSLVQASQTGGTQQQVRITMPILQGSQGSQRLLLPNTSVVRTVSASGSGSVSTAPLPPGTAILSDPQGSQLQGFALVPAQYVAQLQASQAQQTKTLQKKSETVAPSTSTSAVNSQGSYVPIASNDPALSTLIQQSVRHHGINGSNQTAEATGARPRKPCNCTKSQCLKLYCDCFANGEFCQNCNCTNCANNLDHEDGRLKAIKSCLERNPMAFHPKIGKGKPGEGDRRHQKGCNCKRSGCLKNYCECYEAKIMCSALCKCSGCKNYEESPDRKTLMHLADAAEVRVHQQIAATSKLSSQMIDIPKRSAVTTGERLPYSFVTQEVAEAAVTCLIAQAEECERNKMSDCNTQACILQEFGRCLMQIIDSASLTKESSSSAE